MKTKKAINAILIIIIVLMMLLILIQPVSGNQSYGGYPPPGDGYPAPTTDPWCDEMQLLGKNLPYWCHPTYPAPSITKYPATPEVDELEMKQMPKKIGGRLKIKPSGVGRP